VPGEQEWFHDFSFPALLRVARRSYGSAVMQALAEEGFADMPRNGSFVIGAIARTGAPLSQIIIALGVSKQAAGQLVDTLVARGYLDRAADPDDRRRLTISLTGRGLAAAEVIRDAVDRVDAAVLRRVGPEYVAHTRATLAAMIEARHDTEEDGHDQ
jgi:DNA-binding MarR family transcriptional regulator